MIIKTLGVKSKQAVRNLVKYVLAEHKMQPAQNVKPEKAPFVPGVKFTAEALKFLECERVDGYLLAMQKMFKGTREEFVREVLMKGDFDFNRPLLDKLLITHNVPLGTVMPQAKEIIQAYEDNEQYRLTRRANTNLLGHTVISFDARDTMLLSEKALRGMAEHYIQLRGSEGMYTICLHLDRTHVHMHVVESTIGYRTHASMRMSREKYAELKKDMQLFQQRFYPSISHSVVRHGKSKEKETKGRDFYKTERRTSVKNDLSACLPPILSKASTVSELSAELQKSGYTMYYRNEKPTGVICENGLKVRFSRIGIAEQVAELIARERDSVQQLEDMKKLRGKGIGRTFAPERTEKKVDMDKSENGPQTELDEMSALRGGSASVADREDDMESRSQEREAKDDDTDEPIDMTTLPEIQPNAISNDENETV